MENLIKKHGNIITILGLFILCILVYFFNIGNYPLMDVDETRYVSMARDMLNSKDFLTLYLNGEYFFEKPPLYFWGECLSFKLFGVVNEFSARFPGALYGMLSTFAVYFVGKKFVSQRFGLIAAIILTTTVEFCMLAKFAILDIVVASLIGFSVLCGFLTQIVEDKNKKYFWWLFYIFSGLAVMAKGIPGFVVPFGSMFFISIFNKTFKQNFKPLYMIPGFLLFFLIVLPWHIIMFKIHDPLFFNEYIMKHHINRFFSSSEISRKQPFYFYFMTILWGAMPYILAVIAAGIAKLKNWGKIDFSQMPNSRKFLWFNIIAFAFTLLFFSASSTKLITYILPIYFFTSFIMAFIWEEYMFEHKYEKQINVTVYILGVIFTLGAIGGCFMKYYLPAQIYSDISSAQWLGVFILGSVGISSLICAIKKYPKGVFIAYASLVIFASAFITKRAYEIDYKFGQNDLINFAKQEAQNGHQLYVINGARKYSVLYNYGKKVNYLYIHEDTILDDNDKIYDKNSTVIVQNKEHDLIKTNHDFEEIEKGRKYSLVRFKHKK